MICRLEWGVSFFSIIETKMLGLYLYMHDILIKGNGISMNFIFNIWNFLRKKDISSLIWSKNPLFTLTLQFSFCFFRSFSCTKAKKEKGRKIFYCTLFIEQGLTKGTLVKFIFHVKFLPFSFFTAYLRRNFLHSFFLCIFSI